MADRNDSFFESEPLRSMPVDDIEVAYKIFGTGEPLVLITGYIATMDIWDPFLLETLASRYSVVVFDNRGMGKTSAGDAEWSIDRFTEDTAGLIEALGLDRANVMGWSLGGDVALNLAVRYPERIIKLVVYAGDCGGQYKVDPPSLREVLKEFHEVDAHFKRVFAALFPPEWMEAHPHYWKSFSFPRELDSPDSILKQNKAYNEWVGVYEELGGISMPVLLVTGTEDVSTPPENAIMLADRLPQSWLIRFAGAGHGLQYQYPHELAKVVLDFLELSKWQSG